MNNDKHLYPNVQNDNVEMNPSAPTQPISPPHAHPYQETSYPSNELNHQHQHHHQQGMSPSASHNTLANDAPIITQSQQLPKEHHNIKGKMMKLPMEPVTAYCKHCNRNQITRVEDHVGCDTWGTIGCLSILCACMPCCFIPCCSRTCKTQVHRCSQCNHKIGKSKPGLFGRKH